MSHFKFGTEGEPTATRMPLLSVDEVAVVTNLNRRTIYRAINDGELAAFRLRGRIRVAETELDDWVSTQAIAPRPQPRPTTPSHPRRRGAPGGRLRPLARGSQV